MIHDIKSITKHDVKSIARGYDITSKANVPNITSTTHLPDITSTTRMDIKSVTYSNIVAKLKKYPARDELDHLRGIFADCAEADPQDERANYILNK